MGIKNDLLRKTSKTVFERKQMVLFIAHFFAIAPFFKLTNNKRCYLFDSNSGLSTLIKQSKLENLSYKNRHRKVVEP